MKRFFFLITIILGLNLVQAQSAKELQDYKDKMRAAIREQKTDEAVKIADDFLQKYPQADTVLLVKTALLVNQNKCAEAEAVYQQLVKVKPARNNAQDFSSVPMLSYVFTDKMSDCAYTWLQKAIEKYPTSHYPYFFMSAYYEDKQDWEQCLKYGRKAFELDANFYEQEGFLIAVTLRKMNKIAESYNEIHTYIRNVKTKESKERGLEKQKIWGYMDEKWEEVQSALTQLSSLNPNDSSLWEEKMRLFELTANKDSLMEMYYAYLDTEFDFSDYINSLVNVDVAMKLHFNKTKWVYEFSSEYDSYQFILSNVEKTAKTASFDWQMTNEEGSSGSVRLMNLEDDVSLDNYFKASGEVQVYTDRTAIWIPKSIWKRLYWDKEIPITIDGKKDLITEVSYVTYYATMGDIQLDVPAFKLYTEEGDMIYVLRDPDNPIILEMQLYDFGIYLSKVE